MGDASEPDDLYDKHYLDDAFMRQFKAVAEGNNNFPLARPPEGPGKVREYLYIGNLRHAFDDDLLWELGITHVLNCAGQGRHSDQMPYDEWSSVFCYAQLDAVDMPDYDITIYMKKIRKFLDQANTCGGKALVHGVQGINRSAAVCVGHLMMSEGVSLLEAALLVRDARGGPILTNRGFRSQLRDLAAERGLDGDLNEA